MKEQDVFLKEIQKLHEDDFTKLVLLPLFKSMGYFDVHFNGGVVEEGKDLIAFKEGEFGSYTVTVVQSKKVREKAKLSVKKYIVICCS